MSRPMYETAQNRMDELVIAGEFGCFMNASSRDQFRMRKVDIREGSHSPDWAIHNERTDKCVGYIEIKNRDNYSFHQIEDMGGLFLSAAKYTMLKQLSDMDYSVALVVAHSDCLGYYNIKKCEVRAGVGGRFDRNDPKDVEHIVYFNPEDFIIISRGDKNG